MTDIVSNQTLKNVDDLNKKLNKLQEYIYNSIKIDELPKKIDKIKESIKNLNKELNKIDLSSIENAFKWLITTIGEIFINKVINTGDLDSNNSLKKICKDKIMDFYENILNLYQNGANKINYAFMNPFKPLENMLSKLKVYGEKIYLAIGGWNFGDITHAMNNMFMSIGSSLSSLGSSISAITSTATFAYATVIGIVSAIGGAFYQLFNSNDEFRNKVIEAWENIQLILQTAYDNIIQPIFEAITVLCRTVWETGLRPLWNEWIELVDFVSQGVLDMWNGISPFVLYVLECFGPLLSDALGSFASIVGVVIGLVINQFTLLLDKIKNILSSLVMIFSGIISGDMSKVCEGLFNVIDEFIKGFKLMISSAWVTITSLFSNGGKIFEGMSDTVGKTFRSIINKVISGINNTIQTPINYLNGILNDLRKLNVPLLGKIFSWISYNPIKFSFIPYLYNGGFVNPGQLFVANEPGNPELIGNIGGHTAVVNNSMILEGIQKAMRNAIIDGLKVSGMNHDIYVDVYVDGVFNERKLAQLNKRSYLKTGKPVFVR